MKFLIVLALVVSVATAYQFKLNVNGSPVIGDGQGAAEIGGGNTGTSSSAGLSGSLSTSRSALGASRTASPASAAAPRPSFGSPSASATTSRQTSVNSGRGLSGSLSSSRSSGSIAANFVPSSPSTPLSPAASTSTTSGSHGDISALLDDDFASIIPKFGSTAFTISLGGNVIDLSNASPSVSTAAAPKPAAIAPKPIAKPAPIRASSIQARPAPAPIRASPIPLRSAPSAPVAVAPKPVFGGNRNSWAPAATKSSASASRQTEDSTALLASSRSRQPARPTTDWSRPAPPARPAQSQPSAGDVIQASVQTTHTIEVIEAPNTGEAPKTQEIVIPANASPLVLTFQSASSPLEVNQVHAPAERTEPQESQHEEEPQIHKITIVKPIVHEITEIVTPIRRITQEIKPVNEEVTRIVARGQDSASTSTTGAQQAVGGRSSQDSAALLANSREALFRATQQIIERKRAAKARARAASKRRAA